MKLMGCWNMLVKEYLLNQLVFTPFKGFHVSIDFLLAICSCWGSFLVVWFAICSYLFKRLCCLLCWYCLNLLCAVRSILIIKEMGFTLLHVVILCLLNYVLCFWCAFNAVLVLSFFAH